MAFKDRALSRRRFLSTGIAAASALPLGLHAVAETECVLTAEQEVGPFYVKDELVRSRIAEDRVGVPLRLKLIVMDSRGCGPLVGAAIDLWHCDAMGLYSGFTMSYLGPPQGFPPVPPPGGGPDAPGGAPPNGHFAADDHGAPPDRDGAVEGSPKHGPPAIEPSDKLTFLRGIQMTGEDGAVTFETIFPGFYDGRTNHVHFKVRLEGHRQGTTYAAGHTAHVGQVFFPEFWNLKIMANGPYANHKIHRTTAGEDMVFNGQHGSACIANLLQVDPKNLERGLFGQLRVSVDPTATPQPVRGGGPPPLRRLS